MRQIWQEEKPTVIFVTHDIEEAVFLSSKNLCADTETGNRKGRGSGIAAI